MRLLALASIALLVGCAKQSTEARSGRPPVVDTHPSSLTPSPSLEIEPAEPTALVEAPTASGPAEEVMLGDGPARLAEGIVFEREGDHFAFLWKTAPSGETNIYSYIEPGDVELVHDRWLFIRDGKTTARARRWAPRVVKVTGTRGDVALNVGDRIEIGKWTIEWIAVMPGSSAMTGVRILALRSFYNGLPSDYWQSDGKAGTHHDFTGDEGLAQLETTIVAAKMAKEGMKSTLNLRLREVDRAATRAFGSAIQPGLFAFPNGLRVRFEKSTMCATSATNCVCSDVFDVKAEEAGKSESFGIPNDGSTLRKLGHGFRLTNGQLVVTK